MYITETYNGAGVSEQDTVGSGAGWVCPLSDVRIAGNSKLSKL